LQACYADTLTAIPKSDLLLTNSRQTRVSSADTAMFVYAGHRSKTSNNDYHASYNLDLAPAARCTQYKLHRSLQFCDRLHHWLNADRGNRLLTIICHNNRCSLRHLLLGVIAVAHSSCRLPVQTIRTCSISTTGTGWIHTKRLYMPSRPCRLTCRQSRNESV